MAEHPVVVWFRQDLRLSDQPALSLAVESGRPVVPVYVLDDVSPGRWRPGGASRWWLGTSLPRLAHDLERLGSRLIVRRGDAREEIPRLIRDCGAGAVHCSRMVEPWARALDDDLAARLGRDGVAFQRHGGALLREPGEVSTGSGAPYRVYSPFARAAMALPPPRAPLPRPRHIPAPETWPEGLAVDGLDLLPTRPDWAGGLRAAWTPGEAGASVRLDRFLDGAVGRYHAERDRPDIEGTSRLSPHLHHGEISPHACWHRIVAHAGDGAMPAGHRKFLAELLWREFSAHLLFHWPDLPVTPFRPEFAGFPWAPDAAQRDAWQRGETGYPIVDAGMRELWQTGYMHNRVRMIVASFLVKDLLVPWQEGEGWFWDTLVDADLANNAASWQWVAGSGADAAPYFRIFNPVKQGQTFDPEGAYVRRFVPELAGLAAPDIHAPFAAPEGVLRSAGVVLGTTYPWPVVDHQEARRRALAAFQAIKSG